MFVFVMWDFLACVIGGAGGLLDSSPTLLKVLYSGY